MNDMVIGLVIGLGASTVWFGLLYVAMRIGIRIGWDAANQDEPLKKQSPPLSITDTE